MYTVSFKNARNVYEHLIVIDYLENFFAFLAINDFHEEATKKRSQQLNSSLIRHELSTVHCRPPIKELYLVAIGAIFFFSIRQFSSFLQAENGNLFVTPREGDQYCGPSCVYPINRTQTHMLLLFFLFVFMFGLLCLSPPSPLDVVVFLHLMCTCLNPPISTETKVRSRLQGQKKNINGGIVLF